MSSRAAAPLVTSNDRETKEKKMSSARIAPMAGVRIAGDEVDSTPAVEITGHDRCDHPNCGAQAYVAAVFSNAGALFFCGHHFSRHEAKLLAISSSVIDRRDLIDA